MSDHLFRRSLSWWPASQLAFFSTRPLNFRFKCPFWNAKSNQSRVGQGNGKKEQRQEQRRFSGLCRFPARKETDFSCNRQHFFCRKPKPQMVSNTLVAGNDFGCLIGNEFFAGNQALFSGNKKWKPAGNNKQISGKKAYCRRKKPKNLLCLVYPFLSRFILSGWKRFLVAKIH